MIEPQEIEIDGKKFVISKYPATVGREIISKYPIANMPKIGEYAVSDEIMLKSMSYVGVPRDGGHAPLMLTTRALVDSHTGSWETLAKLEKAMLEYNCSFLQSGRIVEMLKDIALKYQPVLSKILTGLSAQSSPAEKPASKN